MFAIGLIASVSMLSVEPALAQDTGQRPISIPAQPASDAITQLARQTGTQILFDNDQLRQVRSRPVSARVTPRQALRIMLEGSPFEVATTPSGALVIRLIGQGDSANVSEGNAFDPLAGSAAASGDLLNDQEIVVTGTNIRGQNRTSPVTVVTRREIERTGSLTVQDVLRNLPQNAGGGSAESLPAGRPGDNASQSNLGLGSGANLRGLGSGSTLVLLNGRRIAPASGIADFVDVSLFPLPIIERVEVLTDGASSIYGGDAVAGVVNLILRPTYDGAEAGASYGWERESGMGERRAYATLGRQWRGGGILFSGEIYDRDNLGAGERSFAADALLPNDLLPSQRRWGLFASVNQELNSNIEFNLFGLSSRRASEFVSTSIGVGETSFKTTATSLNLVNATVVADLSAAWSLNLGAAGSQAVTRSEVTSPSLPSTDRRLRSAQFDLDARLNGNFRLAGLGRVDTALGGQIRRERFRSTDLTTNVSNRAAARTVGSIFGEVQIEPISPASQAGVIDRLTINLSTRYENYSDFGGELTYKLGAAIEPWRGGRFRGTYGTAFNPPDLGRVGAVDTTVAILSNAIINSFFDFPAAIDDPRPIAFLSGTGKSLGPERSVTWTLGFDQTVESGPVTGRIAATYYNIDYRQRIGTPSFPIDTLNAINAYLSGDPALVPGSVTEAPPPAIIAELLALARAESGLFDFFGLLSSDSDVYYIVDSRSQNTSRTRTDGIEFNASAGFPVGRATASLGLSLNKILSFTEQASSVASPLNGINRYLQPADFRGRLSAGLERGGFNAFLALNYTRSYLDDRQTPNRRVPAYVTVDGRLTYAFPESSRLRGLTLGLTATNILDRDPPRFQGVPNFGIFNYDPVNASPLGRMVTLSISKAL